ncbi:MAG: Fur family transcriptional regulator [Deltaproteobacteria bacterium]
MKLSFTDLRREILSVIEQSEKPLTVREIHDKTTVKPNLSTIYRALDFLAKNGLIKSISFSVDGRFFYSAKREHAHFLFCKSCSEIREFARCFADEIQRNIEDEMDYKITDHFFYFAGVCNSCLNIKVKALMENP